MASGGLRLGGTGASPSPAVLVLAVPQLAQHLVEEERIAVGEPAQLWDEVRRRRSASRAPALPPRRGLRPCRCTVSTGTTARRSASIERSRWSGGTSVSMYIPTIPSLGGVDAPQHVAQQEQGRLVGPVEVVDDQQHGAARRQFVQRGRRPPRRSGSARSRGRRLPPRAAVRTRAGAATRRESSASCQSGICEIRSAESDWKYRPSASAKGWNGVTGSLVTAAPEHQRTFLLNGARQLDHQPRLPDAGLAVDEQQAPVAVAHRRPPVAQQARLPGPADERRLVR